MGVSPEQVAAHGDEDHRLGQVDALLVITHETAGSGDAALNSPGA